MSLVIEAPETLSAAVHPTLDDAPVVVAPIPDVPIQRTSAPSWWQTMVHRCSQRHAPNPLPHRTPESAIDNLAREHTFIYIKAMAG